MVDLVGTCPKSFWLEWIAEGDAVRFNAITDAIRQAREEKRP